MSRDSRSRSRSPVLKDDDGDSSPRNRRIDKRTLDKPQRSSGKRSAECRVYVSNIPYEFKWQDLKDLFRSEVGNVAYVEMFNDDNGRPRGSAIVDFETPEMAQRAIEKLHRMEVKGRKLVVKEREEIVHSRDFMFLFNKDLERDRNRFGKDLDRRGSFNRNSFQDNGPPAVNYGNTYGLSISFLESLGINGPLVNKVFVANLDYKVGEDDLKEVFKVAGKVVNAEVIKDQDGKSRGFGVVEYEHPLHAVQAISMLHNQQYYDRKINVRLDRVAEKQQKEGGPSAKLPPGLKGLGMGLGLNGEAITDISALNNLQSANSGNISGMSPAMNSPVGMAGGFNLPTNTNMTSNIRTGVSNALSMMGMGGLENISMAASNLGLALGTPNSLNLGNAGGGGGLNQGAIGGVPNTNNFQNQGMGVPSGNSSGGVTGPMFNNNNSGFNNPSSSNDFNSSGFSSSNNRCVVQITNLPMDYTWKNLKDLCRNYGDIRFAEMKSSGVGWVRFSNENEARRTADLLDRQRFDGRVLDACVV
ncbi:UNVERIFIED_CONTAM: hypothetical protein RMT77_010970 [Armadillidium vulgare]